MKELIIGVIIAAIDVIQLIESAPTIIEAEE